MIQEQHTCDTNFSISEYAVEPRFKQHQNKQEPRFKQGFSDDHFLIM